MTLNSQYGVPATMQAIHNIIDGVTPAYGLATDEDVKALFAPPASLQDADAATIAMLSENGKIQNYYSVGDEKTITLSTGEQVTFVILGFEHDDLSDGSGKAGVTFGMKNLLAATYPMNGSASNIEGWKTTSMRTETMHELFAQLPPDWKAVIKRVDKKTMVGGGMINTITTIDKLFLFSEVEIDGTTTSGYAGEGNRYEYWDSNFADGTIAADRIKYLSNGSGAAAGWWLRTPYISNSSSFRNFSESGSIVRGLASYSYGVCFGFCV